MRRRFLWLLSVALFAAPLSAQTSFDWYSRGPYRATVPRPDSLLGHPIGSRHTMFHEQQGVLDRLIAASPDRVRTEVIGRTAEGRVMRILLISSPENLARLDAIRADLDRLADPRVTTAAQAAEIAERIPAPILLTHSIHGNEPSGFETVMMTAYHLLASENPETRDILDKVIVILNPTQNPDGHERFAAWSNSVAVGADDPAALEQSEPWSIQGRFNHYRFDMNRDFVAQSQLETRALLHTVLRWRPQVVVDLHSTTSQFFFPPTAKPMNVNVGPLQAKWEERFGRANAGAFDRQGWQYYVRDIFDYFYPGYVDLWPSLSGATGMTYETDGGPELRLRKDDGTVMTFEMGIAHHFVASIVTIATLAGSKAERLRDYHQFRAEGMAEARTRRMRRVVVAPGRDPGHTLRVMQLLTGQEIAVTRTTADFSSATAHDYLAGTTGRRTFPAGSYVIDLAQPNARLATALLEPEALLDSAFARVQVERFERNRRRGAGASREGYEFYDLTAWALPLTHGLEAWWTEDAPAVTGTPVTPQDRMDRGAAPARARSAYLFPAGEMASSRLAMMLLREGFTVGVAGEPIEADGTVHARGTYVVRIQRNDTTVHGRITALATRTGALVTAVQSAWPATGQFGVGSEAVRPLKAPRILLAAGDGVSQTSFGDVWFWLERELEVPVVPVDLAALGRVNLADYNVLIIPDGSAGRLAGQIGGAAERLTQWVREGGTIIGFSGIASLLSRKEFGLTTVAALGAGDEEEKKTAATDTVLSPGTTRGPPLVSETAPGPSQPERVPGIIARATLDPTHWLTFGYQGEHLAVPVSGGFLAPSKRGDNPVVIVGEQALLAGFVWPGNTERLLSGSTWASVENVGRGTVVLFANNPLFRAFWRGTAGLVANAILIGPGR